jgi:chromosome partitioning protein
VVEALAEYQFPILQAQLCQRVSFAESASAGLTVLETNPNSTASQEITALIVEILNQ